TEEERDVARIDAEGEGKPAEGLVERHQIAEPARQAEAAEILCSAGKGEDEDLEIEPMGQEQDSEAHPKQQGPIGRALGIDHDVRPSRKAVVASRVLMGCDGWTVK